MFSFLLMLADAVAQALAYLEGAHETHLSKQVQITGIAAPTFHEGERAQFMATEFRRVGLQNVEIDAQGNVLGWRPGASPDALVLAAHLDISFEPGVNTKVRKEGKRWFAPGLADNARGLACILAVAEALNHARIETRRTLLFVANVGEEGLGDLSGVKYLFQQSPHQSRLKAFIAVDGDDPARVVNGGVGVKRYRVTARGAGGHSYANFGRPNAAHALGRMIARLASMETPFQPRTTYNVGRIGGGTAVNAIAEEAWMEVDLRSEGPAELDRLEIEMMKAVRLGAEEENSFREASGQKITVETKLVGNRPAGGTAESHPLVQAALSASRRTGHQPRLEIGSTDSNLPMSLAIPAVTLGGGGKGGNVHSLAEWFEPEGAWRGPQTVLLAILNYDAI
jgi:acetylornithine deacetylase/succinyl-diaminopimelate desuccinylase-like protein